MAFTLLGHLLHAQEPYLEGIARMEDGNYQKAVQLFSIALERDASNPDLILRSAELMFLTEEYGDCIEAANNVNDLSPGKGDFLLARSHAKLGDAPQAVNYLESHMGSDYKLPRHEILLDPAFSGIEDTPAWKSLWRKTWYTENEDFEFEVAYLRKSGNYPDALRKIEDGLGENPRWHRLYAEKGLTLHLIGNWQDAARAWSAAIEILPGQSAYFLGRARSYREIGKYTEGIRDLEQASRKNPEQLELLAEISRICRSAKQYKKAAAYIEQYLLYYPDSPEAHYIKGNIHSDAGQVLQSIVSYNRCLELDKSNAAYYAARGRSYLQSDTWTYAFSDLSMALDLDPGNNETWYLRGLCRLNLGEKEKARADLETAARLGSIPAIGILEKMDR